MNPTEIVNKKILIACLDWGMGHLTRSSVLIKKFIAQNNQITFAGNAFQINFIKREFPDIEVVSLSGYEVKLSSQKNTYLQLFSQFYKLNKSVNNEKKWLNDLLKNNQFDIIISDNRYGFYSSNIYSILLSHQLRLQVPFFKKIVNRKLSKFHSKFNEIWIPDLEDKSLTGDLSNNQIQTTKTYIGLLSRFNFEKRTILYDFVAIVSGPMPESIRFQNMLLELQLNSKKNILIITPHQPEKILNKNICINPSTEEMNKILNESNTIIARAGYTTIMDVVTLNKNAILIPTPGQYEQTYLASIVKHKRINFYDEHEFLKLVKQGFN